MGNRTSIENIPEIIIKIRESGPGDIKGIYSLLKEFAVFQNSLDKLLITPQQMFEDKDLFQCLVAVTQKK